MSEQPSDGLLQKIVATKQQEVTVLRPRLPELRDRARDSAAPPDFRAALTADAEHMALIAEVKRKSPSAGVIQALAEPALVAASYGKAGARAVSVLTDRDYFGGSIDDLLNVTQAVAIPALRKDFTIDEVQVYEARAYGASAILLIVRLLDTTSLTSLRLLAEDLGMQALVEVHDDYELDSAIASGASIIGVNNRNLDTLTIDLQIAEGLIPRVPADVIAIAESGVRGPDDAQRMAAAGADAILVGESLMRSNLASGAAAISSIRRDRGRRMHVDGSPTSHTGS